MPPISGAWAKALEGEFHKPYYKKLFETVSNVAVHEIRQIIQQIILFMR